MIPKSTSMVFRLHSESSNSISGCPLSLSSDPGIINLRPVREPPSQDLPNYGARNKRFPCWTSYPNSAQNIVDHRSPTGVHCLSFASKKACPALCQNRSNPDARGSVPKSGELVGCTNQSSQQDLLTCFSYWPSPFLIGGMLETIVPSLLGGKFPKLKHLK